MGALQLSDRSATAGISVPAIIVLSLVIIYKGAGIGVKALYFVVAILFISLVCFFLGKPIGGESYNVLSNAFGDSNKFFIVFAIVFPAFTGMTAGVGLSGDLKDPGRSIPLGTLTATISGMIIYFFIIWKLASSASTQDLLSNQLVMSDIALFGFIIIPLGLAASTISSAIGSFLVAPRTLQALSVDESFPFAPVNKFLAKGVGEQKEPRNASIIIGIIATVFVILGDVDIVASIITMFFMVTYGSLCLISFLYHFGADPSYRPRFRSRWYISLFGFLMCLLLMIQISVGYTIISIVIITLIYVYISRYHREREGLSAIFQSSFYQLSRRVYVYLQKAKKADLSKNWRPSAVCVSRFSFERDKALQLLNWISYKFGFGTYIHLLEGYYSTNTNNEARKILSSLIERSSKMRGNIYVDTIISPSFTSAIAQLVQLPSPSGMENNMIIFEYDKHFPQNLEQIIDNIALVQAGDFDVCILGSSSRNTRFANGIHVWLRNRDKENASLMILLSYIILGHPSWQQAEITLFSVCNPGLKHEEEQMLKDLILFGRLPIVEKNIVVIELDPSKSFKSLVNEYSYDAGLTIIGFKEEQLKHEGLEFFDGYNKVGDVLFVDAKGIKEIR